MWKSLNPVHFADDTIDYLSIICYHDNDIANGTYSNVGDIKRQGEIFNRTGTGGNVTGDHLHLETGKGRQNSFIYHFTDNTTAKRIVPDKALFTNDTIVTPYPRYDWVDYQGGHPPTPTQNKNNWKKWYLSRRKILR